MKHLSFLLAIAAITASPLFAQSLETGIDAFEAEDYETATLNLSPIAEQGDMVAQYYLGELFALGHGANSENASNNYDHGITESERWIRLSAEQGYPYAQYRLGTMYADSVPLTEGFLLEQNPAEATRLFDLAAKQLTALAEQGDAQAQFTVGYMYSSGRGLPLNVEQTTYWYTASAEQGYAKAQHMLGKLYETGEGVSPDIETAASWYLKAAEQEYFMAMMQISAMYFEGNGVSQDNDRSSYWLQRAVQTN